jgi:hypothetical protein
LLLDCYGVPAWRANYKPPIRVERVMLQGPKRRWRVRGTDRQEVNRLVDVHAVDHDDAVRIASRSPHCLIVHSVVLWDDILQRWDQFRRAQDLAAQQQLAANLKLAATAKERAGLSPASRSGTADDERRIDKRKKSLGSEEVVVRAA